MLVFIFNIAPFTSWLSLSLFIYGANRAKKCAVSSMAHKWMKAPPGIPALS